MMCLQIAASSNDQVLVIYPYKPSVLDECHHKDPHKAMMIVERKSPCWNDMMCLQIAASSNDQVLMSFTHINLVSLMNVIIKIPIKP